MDSRWRFLHHIMTELWGRTEEAQPGNGKTGVSTRSGREANPPSKGSGVMPSEVKVAKCVDAVPGKAAIVHDMPVPKTDTGRREENSNAGERSIVKELGKMTP